MGGRSRWVRGWTAIRWERRGQELGVMRGGWVCGMLRRVGWKEQMGAWLDGSSLGKEGAGVRRDDRWLGLWNVAESSTKGV
ncbi:hypothetical protein, conserved [Eimeria tenella]|uniref:Uncharacterized protein n=1 Tax=Eimeria tenella TaxID=5802 RepID=U6KYB4_EIMTE|nr:hypothetical protein, conserved [Eimeria tenella]CDJ43172.1 hypothetical protein, conserved [Eimeria tenella]|eukprot:XP_013233922.1 hypothetical protein, conserved [Eimeria tenella]